MSKIKELKSKIQDFDISYFRAVAFLLDREPLYDWCLRNNSHLKMCDLEVTFKGKRKGFKPKFDLDAYFDCYIVYNKHTCSLSLVTKSEGILYGSSAIRFLDNMLKIGCFITVIFLSRGYMVVEDYPILGINLMSNKEYFDKADSVDLRAWYTVKNGEIKRCRAIRVV